MKQRIHPKDIRIADYNYQLPDERIAKYPLAVRDQSKLLVYRHGNISEDTFTSLPDQLSKGALMVFNNTRVIRARLHFTKETGAQIEVFCMEPFAPQEYQQNFLQRGSVEWLCMIGNLKRWKSGLLQQTITMSRPSQPDEQVVLTAERLPFTETNATGTNHRIRFSWSDPTLSFSEVLEAVGELPIPPYLNRKTEASDLSTYQTVYSKVKGSVAAPTAGLHFTERVLQALDAKGIDREEVTLHVGAGTFKPVKSALIADHEMHAEYIVVSRQTIGKLIRHNGEAIAVGTTSVRTLESLYYIGRKLASNPDASEAQLHVGQWEPYEKEVGDANEESRAGIVEKVSVVQALTAIANWLDRNQLPALHTTTQIIIAPGYEYKIVKAIVTNFHQPQSTLLLLVSAFVDSPFADTGNDTVSNWRRIYDFALSHGFRFLSYGDSSLLIP